MSKEMNTIKILLLFNVGYVIRGVFDIIFLKSNMINDHFFQVELAHIVVLIFGDMIPLGSVLLFHKFNFNKQVEL